MTCSDEAVGMRVIAVSADQVARCLGPDGGESDVQVDLVAPVAVGDHVLVHAGTALSRLVGDDPR